MLEGYGAEVELVPGVAGVFDITVDGRLAYSKKQTGRFPTDEEVAVLFGGLFFEHVARSLPPEYYGAGG